MRKYGRFTIPTQAGFLEETKELIRRWGADAIRNSDGTNLTKETEALRPAKIYSTYFVARGYNEFARAHLGERQRIFLMSCRHTAVGTQLSFPIMEGYFDLQLEPDYDWDPEHTWEVRDQDPGSDCPPGTGYDRPCDRNGGNRKNSARTCVHPVISSIYKLGSHPDVQLYHQ